MAEQKKQAELRRAKAIAKEKESAYYYVPKVAAAAFERTVTSVLMGERGKEEIRAQIGARRSQALC